MPQTNMIESKRVSIIVIEGLDTMLVDSLLENTVFDEICKCGR